MSDLSGLTLDLEDFGAIRDGKTDCTPAFRRAMAYFNISEPLTGEDRCRIAVYLAKRRAALENKGTSNRKE